MNESERLAAEIEKALDGGAWHGPSLREALQGIDRQAALERPVAGAHTIAEIALHATTWNDVVRRRLEGEAPQVPDDQDWPRAEVPDDAAWDAIVSRVFDTGHALCEAVRRFPPAKLLEERPRVGDLWFHLVVGQLQHVLYHTGQVSLLRKAVLRTQETAR